MKRLLACVVALSVLDMLAVETAGDLVVDLNASRLNLSAGAAVSQWNSLGTVATFNAVNADTPPTYQLRDGVPVVRFAGVETMLKSVESSPTCILGHNDFSIELWVCSEVPTDTHTVFATASRDAGNGSCCEMRYSTSVNNAVEHYGTSYNLGWYGPGSQTAPTGWTFPTPGVWHHLVHTYDGFFAKFYVDGRLVANALMTGLNLSSDQAYCMLGGVYDRKGDSYIYGFRGDIASVRVHDGVLTAPQVLANFEADAATFGRAADSVQPYAINGVWRGTAFTGDGLQTLDIGGTEPLVLDGLTATAYGLQGDCGFLEVRNGTLTVPSSMGHFAFFGYGAGSVGGLTVGAGGVLNARVSLMAGCFNGQGQVTVKTGGVLDAVTLRVGDWSTESSGLFVSEQGSQTKLSSWLSIGTNGGTGAAEIAGEVTVAGTTYLGEKGGSGEVTIQPGGRLQTQQVRPYDTGTATLNIQDGTLVLTGTGVSNMHGVTVAGTSTVEVPLGVTSSIAAEVTPVGEATPTLCKTGLGTLALTTNLLGRNDLVFDFEQGGLRFDVDQSLPEGMGNWVLPYGRILDLNGHTLVMDNAVDNGALVNSSATKAMVQVGRGDADVELGFAQQANVVLQKVGTGTLTVNGSLGYETRLSGATVCRAAAYRHYRFVVLRACGPTCNSMEFAEFKLLDGDTDVTGNRSGSQVNAVSGSSPEKEPPEKALDGLVQDGSKYLDFRCAAGTYRANMGEVRLQIDYDEPQRVTGYDWATSNMTAGRNDSRDPADWLVQGSNDGEVWVTLDHRTNFTAPAARWTWAGPFELQGAGRPASVFGATGSSLALNGVALQSNALTTGPLTLDADSSLTMTEGVVSADLSGTGTLVKQGPAEAALVGTPQFAGELRVAGGRFDVAAFRSWKWFRMTFKKREGSDSSDSNMETSEFALFDADGNRVNLNLREMPAGTTARDLAPSSFAQAADYRIWNNNEAVSRLFDGNTATKWCVDVGANNPSDSNTWRTVTLRLADSAPSVAGYLLSSTIHGATHYHRNPTTWTLEASPDGEHWMIVDAPENVPVPHTAQTAYHGGVPWPIQLAELGGTTAATNWQWFRMTFKKTEGGDIMETSELALYDLSGNRVNLNLTEANAGTPAAQLSPGSFALDQAYAHGNNEDETKLFDNNTQTKWCVTRGKMNSPDNASTWCVVTMRVPAGTAAVTGYLLTTTIHAEGYWQRNPSMWTLEASADGTTWTTVDAQTNVSTPHTKTTAYNNGVPWAIAQPEQTADVVVSGSLGCVSVAAGATLGIAENLDVTVKGVFVDWTDCGTITRLLPAKGGVLTLTNVPADLGREFEIPLEVETCEGEFKNWTVTINGVERRSARVVCRDQRLWVRAGGLTIFVR